MWKVPEVRNRRSSELLSTPDAPSLPLTANDPKKHVNLAPYDRQLRSIRNIFLVISIALSFCGISAIISLRHATIKAIQRQCLRTSSSQRIFLPRNRLLFLWHHTPKCLNLQAKITCSCRATAIHGLFPASSPVSLMRTPETSFVVCQQSPTTCSHVSLTLSYPWLAFYEEISVISEAGVSCERLVYTTLPQPEGVFVFLKGLPRLPVNTSPEVVCIYNGITAVPALSAAQEVVLCPHIPAAAADRVYLTVAYNGALFPSVARHGPVAPSHPPDTAAMIQLAARQAGDAASQAAAAIAPAGNLLGDSDTLGTAHSTAVQLADTTAAFPLQGGFDPKDAVHVGGGIEKPRIALPAAYQPALTLAASPLDGDFDKAGANGKAAVSEGPTNAKTAAEQLDVTTTAVAPDCSALFSAGANGIVTDSLHGGALNSAGSSREGGALGNPSSALPAADQVAGRKFLCACTMMYNSADMLEEWVRHHAELGMQHFFILDNASEDNLTSEVARIAAPAAIQTEAHASGHLHYSMSDSALAPSPSTESAGTQATQSKSSSPPPISPPPHLAHSSVSNATVVTAVPTASSSSSLNALPSVNSMTVSDSTVRSTAVRIATASITWLPWPWPKSQEAGLSFCAASSRSLCDWVMFLDVDEFIFPAALPTPQRQVREQRRRGKGRGADRAVPPHLSLIRSLLPQMLPLHAIITAYTGGVRGRDNHESAVNKEEGCRKTRFGEEAGACDEHYRGERGEHDGEERGQHFRRTDGEMRNAEGETGAEGGRTSHDHTDMEGGGYHRHHKVPPNPLSNLSLIPPPGVDPSQCVIPSQLSLSCLTFGPSGHTSVPGEGLRASYTCRLRAPERFKSIVRVDALAAPLTNVVHRFTALKAGHCTVNVRMDVASVFHYKYPAWPQFARKFSQRASAYVADWGDSKAMGSQDRAPGLGTQAEEPSDWKDRFCEVNDTRMKRWRDEVVRVGKLMDSLNVWQP